MQQVGVIRVTPASRKRPMSRSGIFFPFRASDEQNGFPRKARTDDRYRCFGFCHIHFMIIRYRSLSIPVATRHADASLLPEIHDTLWPLQEERTPILHGAVR